MKRFQSRLDSLQRIRHQQEQLAGIEAASAQQRLQQAQAAVSELQQQLDITNQNMGQLQRNNVGAEIFQGVMRLYDHQQAELEFARQACAEAESAANMALDAWNESRKDLKAIEQRINTERREHRRLELVREEHRQQETTAHKVFVRSNSENGVPKQ